jgi:hypothetical protein
MIGLPLLPMTPHRPVKIGAHNLTSHLRRKNNLLLAMIGERSQKSLLHKKNGERLLLNMSNQLSSLQKTGVLPLQGTTSLLLSTRNLLKKIGANHKTSNLLPKMTGISHKRNNQQRNSHMRNSHLRQTIGTSQGKKNHLVQTIGINRRHNKTSSPLPKIGVSRKTSNLLLRMIGLNRKSNPLPVRMMPLAAKLLESSAQRSTISLPRIPTILAFLQETLSTSSIGLTLQVGGEVKILMAIRATSP